MDVSCPKEKKLKRLIILTRLTNGTNDDIVVQLIYFVNMRKIVGQVTLEEKNEIQTLFERRNGLNELAKIVTADNAELYEKLVKDMGETVAKFQNWWDRMGQKYQWESSENGNWEINFDTHEIFLVTE